MSKFDHSSAHLASVVLLTGGNSGIGLAAARLFIEEGAQVDITGGDQKTLDGAIAELGYRARVATTLTSPLRKIASGSSQSWSKISPSADSSQVSSSNP